MDTLLREFLTESLERMLVLEEDVVRLEQQPDDPELLAGIFRAVHTIKGTCGFLKLARLAAVAHAVENVLARLRDKELAATPAVAGAVLEALDRIKEILDGLAAGHVEPPGDDSALIALLEAIAATGAPAAHRAAGYANGVPLEPSASAESDPARAAISHSAEAKRGQGATALAGQTLRVPTGLLDRLMTLVGELVLARNQLVPMARCGDDPALRAPLQRLTQITDERQDGVMQTRKQAIGTVWSRLPRLVRDLALELDKEIELTMQGAETELDRQVLETIRDPLTHMVRNAADHGLENAAERHRLGKPAKGTITLRAGREGGQVIVQISDDGKGLDTSRIAQKAIATGLVSDADMAGMAERDIQRLIFHAGFSTAEAVTAVSGRGVGMEVVRTNIEAIGGSIEIRSLKGHGATFRIKIPLAPGIVPASRVAAGCMRGSPCHNGPVSSGHAGQFRLRPVP
jgi:two-component system, chemotaxis family, sensor kinase CheA